MRLVEESTIVKFEWDIETGLSKGNLANPEILRSRGEGAGELNIRNDDVDDVDYKDEEIIVRLIGDMLY